MKILFVISATGAGKSTLLDAFEALPPEHRIATIRIGKILTERYPISYFQGRIAPDHTQEEAMKIALDGIGAAFAEGKKLCVVDGLPRKPWQVDEIEKRWPNDAIFAHLCCDQKERLERLGKRDRDDDKKWLHTLGRLNTDEVEVYRVLSKIGERHISFDTSGIGVEHYGQVAELLADNITRGVIVSGRAWVK